MGNNKPNRGNTDKYVKPGDDKIVSGKGFLISMPQVKSGNPSHKLISSANNKAEQKEQTAQNSQNDKKQTLNANQPQQQKHSHKSRRHNHKRAEAVEEKATANVQVVKEQPTKKTPAPKQDAVNEPAKSAEGNNGNLTKQGHGNHKGKDRFKRHAKKNDAPTAELPKQAEKQTEEQPKQPQKQEKVREQKPKIIQKQKQSGAQDRHEKSSQSSAKNDSHNDKRNNTINKLSTNFIQDAISPLKGKSSVSDKKKSNEQEPVYVDRNRPLAEQILEQQQRVSYRVVSGAPDENKTEVVGIRFREAGKIYYFSPEGLKIKSGEKAIVETARGLEYGFVAIGNVFVDNAKIVPPLKSIIRVATEQDTERYLGNKKLEVNAAAIFREKVEKLSLEMSLVYVEYTFDNSKLLFYFTADGRVDFRELIKELAAVFRTRIELRQIGVRDEAKLVGGLGICGRPVCCNTFLSEFSQVSIKMAKEQNLFLNSSKISGTCGRFMCCLKFEDETYQKEYEHTPKVGSKVETPDGVGMVVESNAIKGCVKVMLESKNDAPPQSYDRGEVKLLEAPKQAEQESEADGADVVEE